MPPAPLLPQVPDALAKSARQRFQHRYAEPLSDEDGREIATNLLGVFGLLKEWREAAARSAPSATQAPALRKRRTTTPSAE